MIHSQTNLHPEHREYGLLKEGTIKYARPV